MKEVPVNELARGLSDFIDRGTYRREDFLIMRNGKPMASLSPVPTGVRVRDLERTLTALPGLSPEDLADIESDLAEIREASNETVADSGQ